MKTEAIAEWTHREVGTLIHSVARYTRFVRSTKVVLGILVLFLLGAVVFYLFTKNEEAGIRVAFTSIEKGASSPTQMINARFHGMDKSNQPFNVTADTATQRSETMLDLNHVTGDISLASGVWLAMSAKTGVFNMSDHLLDLKGAIEMFDDEGYEFRTEVMHVDIGQKTAVTHEHVEGQGPLGTLKAHGAHIDGKAQVITFDGPVFVTLYPSQNTGPKREGTK